MISTKEQVLTFLEKCDELKKSKFIVATTKIKDLLKCIVNSPELYRLFDTVTDNFNYLEQKSKCLITTSDGYLTKSYVSLPPTVGQRLAFIFCLLTEFDSDSLNFNEFLEKYFYEDSSYFSSYQSFCRVIITSLEDLIKQVYRDVFEEQTPVEERPTRAEYIYEILTCVEAEASFIYQSSLRDEDKDNGIKMLSALAEAVKQGNEELIDAFVCAYNYYILYNRCVSDKVTPMIEKIAEYMQIL